MNILSGVTWKGTKLRIGEAKPDFRERYATSGSVGGEILSGSNLLGLLKNKRLPKKESHR